MYLCVCEYGCVLQGSHTGAQRSKLHSFLLVRSICFIFLGPVSLLSHMNCKRKRWRSIREQFFSKNLLQLQTAQNLWTFPDVCRNPEECQLTPAEPMKSAVFSRNTRHENEFILFYLCLEQKRLLFSGSGFLNLTISCFSFSLMTVNKESLDFVLLVGHKKQRRGAPGRCNQHFSQFLD